MLRRLRRCVARVGARATAIALPALAGMLVTATLLPAQAQAQPQAQTQAQAAGSSAVPAGFVGMNVDGPLYPTLSAGINPFAQAKLMEQSGVESVRAAFSWAYAQPYRSFKQVPAAERSQFVDVGGVPTRFGQMDALVAQAARFGMSVLPIVIYAPSWDASGGSKYVLPRPARDGPYGAFLTALVHRYGPGGSFSQTHPSAVPITRWQIWNEPDVGFFWPVQPFAATYVALLKAASHAIRAADPSAQVVLAGLANYSWQALATIYQVPGARAAFDVAAAHPYTAEPDGVITILQYVRKVMDENGDRAKPLIASELGWTSSAGNANPADGGVVASTTEQGQASDTAALLPMLAQDRQSLGLAGFYYYSWASTAKPGYNFSYAGLFAYADGTLRAKPAYAAFRSGALAMEDCRVKGSVASVCAQP
jgi:hypothetical protein